MVWFCWFTGLDSNFLELFGLSIVAWVLIRYVSYKSAFLEWNTLKCKPACAVDWRKGNNCHPFPFPDYFSAGFACRFFFFASSPNADPGLRLLTKVTSFLFQMCTRWLHPQDVSVWLQWRLHGGRHIRWINLLSLSKWTMWFWTRNMPVLSKFWWQVWLDCLHHRNLFLWYWSHKRSYNPIWERYTDLPWVYVIVLITRLKF